MFNPVPVFNAGYGRGRQPSQSVARLFSRLLLLLTLLCSRQLLAQVPDLQMAADSNGDGLVVFADNTDTAMPVDVASAERPLLFWLNDDQDNLPLYESWPHDAADNRNEVVGSLRDLEDLTRLQLRIRQWQHLQPDNTWLGFRWQGASPPAIRLWQSADPTGSRSYLLNEDAGQRQLKTFSQALGVVGPEQPLFVRLDQFPRQALLPLLFEGVSRGTGILVATLYQGQQAIASSELPMDIRPVKSFYQRVAVPWPDNITFPYEYKGQPPQPELHWQDEPLGEDFVRPWYEDDNLLVWVHGWIPHDDDNYRRTLVFSFETMFKRLWHQGYRGRIIHFHWPTRKVKGAFGLLSSEYLALKSGKVLYEFSRTLPADKHRLITCHSLGGVVLAEALRQGLDFDTAIFQVSAVPAESFDTREQLLVEELRNTPTPRAAESGGWAGYVGDTSTRIYNFFNPQDVTWLGWNLAQREAKPYWRYNRTYKYYPERPADDRTRMKYWYLFTRPVKDRDESMAYLMNAKTQALGAEARVRGLVHESVNLAHAPYSIGSDHVAMWRWNPQQVMVYFNLMLDTFDVPYNGLGDR